jgi:hypothetical protein
MKKIFFLAAVLCLSAVGAFGQAKTDFSGTWVLDAGKSKLDERARIESMTMNVAQTDKELKVTTETKRMAPPADAPQGGPGGGRGMGGRGFGAGDGAVSYSLDGKETTVEVDGPNGKMPVKYKAMIEGATANLSSARTISGGPMGEITVTGKDSWSLSADGKTLTVVREQTTPRGSSSSTLVFVKK